MTRGRPGTPPRKIREIADALLQRGIRPTVQLIRQMIGGSPNTIAPILREWRETLTPEQQLHLPLSDTNERRPAIPSMIMDLATELWQRAIVFATIECRGSPQALQLATISEEAEQLRASNRSLIERVEKEANEVINLRLQLADLQAVAKAAVDKAQSSDARCEAATSEMRETKMRLVSVSRRRAAGKRVAQAIRTLIDKRRRDQSSGAKTRKLNIRKRRSRR